MATTKRSSRPTKKDLEAKITDLEKKLERLSSTLGSKPAPKPAKTTQAPPPPPPPKPEAKPAETPKPAEAPPKPAEKPAAAAPPAPATNAQALEVLYRDSAMSNPFDYKTKTPGYSPGPNRYYERLHAKRGSAPTSDWNLQKAKVTGYTAPSNNYFATRQRMAYHPADKRFEGLGYKITGVEAPPAAQQTQQAPPPPPPQQPKPDATLPKGMKEASKASSTGSGPAKTDLESYEAEYLARLDRETKEAAEFAAAAEELAAKKRAEAQAGSGSSGSSSRGTLPKGF